MPADSAAMLHGVVLLVPWDLVTHVLTSTWGKKLRPWPVQPGELDMRLLPELDS